MSERFDLSDPAQHEAGLLAAADAIRKGELIVLPTDTVYGVGADAFTPWAVARLLAAKGRGRDMPPPVLVGTVRAATALVDDFGPFGQDLIDEFWPGGLTLVARATPTLAWDLGDTRGTVAVRMPLHADALDLLKKTGPMAVSSANITGNPVATTADEAVAQLGDSISVYLDGGRCGGGVASTIIDLTGSVPRMLRAGAISMDRLREVAALVTGEEVNPPEPDGTAADGTEPASDAVEPDTSPDLTDSSEVPAEAPAYGPPVIPSDSPADIRADALVSATEAPPTEDRAAEAGESPAEFLMDGAGEGQLGADDPGAPVTSESATAEPGAPAASVTSESVTTAKPARARKPAARKTPATSRTTKVNAEASADETPATPRKAARKPATRTTPAERKTTPRKTAARNTTSADSSAPGDQTPGDQTGIVSPPSDPESSGPA
jgi:L-threonylcarbamoyladenylate synthase